MLREPDHSTGQPPGRRDGETAAVEIRRLRAEEAAGLVRCFERCYGNSYVVEDFYDEASIRRLLEAGTLRSVVAVSPKDGIVGHMAITVRHADARTVDAGNTVVDPRYRGEHLAARLGACLVELCREHGFVGFHHFPTTAHPVMQKLAVQGGGIETGVMLAYIPAETEYREVAVAAPARRHAVVIVYQPITAAPSRDVFVPARYRTILEDLYRQCGLQRRVRVGSEALVPASVDAETNFDPRRRLRRMDVARAGDDLAQLVEDAEADDDADVVHVDLSLADPSIEAAVELLRARGFFYCGLLPEQRGGDTLRLQRLRSPDRSMLQPQLATDGGKRLLAVITTDRGEEP